MQLIHLAYMLASVLFILGLKRMQRIKTSSQGNFLASLAMLIAIVATLLDLGHVDWGYIIAGIVVGSAIGAVFALRVQMTAMPQMVALFNGFGGLASALVALSFFFEGSGSGTMATIMRTDTAVTIALSILIGSLTFTGSLVAWGKLEGKIGDAAVVFKGQHFLTLALAIGALVIGYFLTFAVTGIYSKFLVLALFMALSLALGYFLVIGIGGADMPVVISLLNSYSGLAAAMTGFVIQNNLLIISGSLVGAAGLILTKIMCDAMNRSLANVLFGGFGATPSSVGGGDEYTNIKKSDAEEAADTMKSASKVIIVPGYGLAVAQAQHVCREMGDLLEAQGVEVAYAIHPVAGRMPGHMNVLLAEANVPYDRLFEMDEINSEFATADVALVLGANDVVNPAALDDEKSPIYGMPILNVHDARTVYIVKRSLSPGFAGIPNKLFDGDNTYMLFSDAKLMLTQIVEELKK